MSTTYLTLQTEPDRWLEATAQLDQVLLRHSGSRFAEEKGSGRVAARFESMATALAAASSLQGPWRMAIHLPSEESGPALVGIAHPGQLLLSAGSAGLLAHQLPTGAILTDLGRHRLRDLRSVAQVYQLTLPGAPAEFGPLPSMESVPNNLPLQVTSFVGRRWEMGELGRRVTGGARLLTLTGPGGNGKTRLAVQLAAELLARFPDGVYMVDLSALTEGAQVAGALATVLGIREEPGRTPTEGVAAALATRRVLLLLDNCEHLITAAADLANTLLLGCPHLQLITTSREPLAIPGETVWPVPTLGVPTLGDAVTLSTATEFEAVRLFIERARAVSPAFTLTEANAASLATLCSRLDGVPLAIELAAARTRLLTVEQIADRLDDRLRLLAAGGRGGLPRHQTLRAAIDWSYDLLTETERSLWRRVAIFADRFTLAAAEAVCTDAAIDRLDLLELLAQLVDKSIVVAEEVEGENCYRLLESIREYGRERLREAGEEEALLTAHRRWCVTFAEEAAKRWSGPEQRRTAHQLTLAQESLRQAVNWSLAIGEAGPALTIGGALSPLWVLHGQFSEGRDLLRRVLALADEQTVDPLAKAQLLSGLGMLCAGLGEFDTAEGYYARGIAISRGTGDSRGEALFLNRWGLLKLTRAQYREAGQLLEAAIAVGTQQGFDDVLAAAHLNLGAVYSDQGDFATARRLLATASEYWQCLGNTTSYAPTLEVLGGIAIAEGDLETATGLYEQSLAAGRAAGDVRGISVALTGLATIALLRQGFSRCRELAGESLRLRQSVGNSLGIAISLEICAWLLAAEGGWADALRLAGGADAVRQRVGAPVPPVRRERSERLLAPAREGLGETAAEAAFAAGAQMGLAALVELACAAPAVAPVERPVAVRVEDESLTARELEIVQLLASGLKAREIGQRLFLSPRTVEKHEEKIRTKLDLPNRAALVAWAVRRGLVEGSK